MIEKLTAYIQPIVVGYGAFGVFLATLLEEIIAPIPSSLVPFTAGFFLLPSAENHLVEIVWRASFIIALPVALGITLASIAVYSIGFTGRKPAIEKNKKWLGLKWEDLEKIENRLTRTRYDEIVLFALRILPIVPGVAISGFCGIVRYPLKAFATLTFLGSFTRALLLGIIGWNIGEAYAAYSEIISKVEKYIFAVVVILATIFLARLYIRRIATKKRESKEN